MNIYIYNIRCIYTPTYTLYTLYSTLTNQRITFVQHYLLQTRLHFSHIFNYGI